MGSCHDSLKGFVWCHLYTIASSSKELFCVLIGSKKDFPRAVPAQNCCTNIELTSPTIPTESYLIIISPFVSRFGFDR
ncbi:hypothetical protein BpHYR1_001906 [Brachionus plicatilis]|uniref:Uncharacterized protein n=1 Tax=Brachionus plicatilis TaxID=10195 RepID=A0A3M7SJ79_BRAPC|nr:hypothetical protein BpHYR1_001906 [Brachionus plicatilis]